MTDGQHVLAGIELLLTSEHQRLTPESKAHLTGLGKHAKALALPTAEKEKDIRNNPRWSKYERREKLSQLIPDAQSLASGILNDKAKLDAKLARLTVTLSEVPPRHSEPTLRQLRGMEIRQTLRSLAETERVKFYMAAAEANNVELLDAILQSPEPLIAEEIKTRGVQAWADKTMPQTVQEAAQARELSEQLGALLTMTNAWIAGLEAK